MGSQADLLASTLKLEFTTETNKAKVKMPCQPLATNFYGNVHNSTIGSLPEFCAGHFIQKVLAVDAEARCISLRKIEHTFHGATTRPVEAILELDECEVVALKQRLAKEHRTELQLRVVVRDEEGRQIATSTSTWFIGPSE